MSESQLAGRSTVRKSPIGSGQQMFFVRKRSGSDKCFMCESAAAATDVLCAKAKRQRQDVGHTSFFTGCEGFSLCSSIYCGG
ncbi:hypothetical protein ACQKII_18380 [Lysinibacillus sp. NPDC048646]|uniref:hypothetical protein n=1 Tax=Lysinibacillus sp. NPDC048646 TaxID=3390574 RepID=UPI003D068F27